MSFDNRDPHAAGQGISGAPGSGGWQPPQSGAPHPYAQPGSYAQPGPYLEPGAVGQGSYGAAPSARPDSLAGRVLAPRPSRRVPTLVCGAVLALTGVLMMIFSCLTWATASDKIHETIPMAGSITGSVSLSVSGLGSVSTDVAVDVSGLPQEYRDAIGKQLQQGAETGELENDTSAPGIVTLIVGALLVAASIPLLLGRFTAVAALGASAVALAGLIAAVIFTADPAAAVVSGDAGDTTGVGVGYGLWIVLVTSLVAVASAAAAVVLSLLPTRPLPQGPTGPWGTAPQPPNAWSPQPGQYPPGYAQPGQPQAGYAQPGQPQPGYAQPGYPQPGYPQAPGQAPGQPGWSPEPPSGQPPFGQP